MVVVSHEIKFALDVSTKVVVMDGGVIVEQGAPKNCSAIRNTNAPAASGSRFAP